jgi:transposase
MDPRLLSPIVHLVHRSEQAQLDLTTLGSRDVLVRSRTQLVQLVRLVNHVRGTVKSLGGRLPKCSTPSFVRQVIWSIPDALRSTLAPVLQQIDTLSTPP